MNNIVVRGLETHENIKPKEAKVELLEKEMDIKCKIKSTTIIKNYKKESIVIAELGDLEDKARIMKNKYKLRGQKIFIDNDWTKKEREIHAKIRKKAKEERGRGKNLL